VFDVFIFVLVYICENDTEVRDGGKCESKWWWDSSLLRGRFCHGDGRIWLAALRWMEERRRVCRRWPEKMIDGSSSVDRKRWRKSVPERDCCCCCLGEEFTLHFSSSFALHLFICSPVCNLRHLFICNLSHRRPRGHIYNSAPLRHFPTLALTSFPPPTTLHLPPFTSTNHKHYRQP
jgi:hypothetical protein